MLQKWNHLNYWSGIYWNMTVAPFILKYDITLVVTLHNIIWLMNV